MLTYIAFALQAGFAAAFGPTDLANPNILVPDSSIPKWYDAGRAVHSHVLIWRGAPQHPHAYYDPIAMNEPESQLSGPLAYSFTPAGFGPSDVRTAYDIPQFAGAKAIAIVDAYHYASALADFNTFSLQFGLPKETSTSATASTNPLFQVVYQGNSAPSVNTSWNVEAALDIEWVHAIAPNAKIYLVEANSSSLSDMFAAVRKAATLPNVKEVSMSWGSSEFSSEIGNDSAFVQNGVVFFASTGDTQAVQEYPSESPNVVAAGGTTLNMSHGKVTSETPWLSAGGGLSRYEPRPSYQSNLSTTVGSKRSAADLSAIADPNTGVAIYCKGWMVVGGTSLSCPVLAAMTNAAGSFLGSSTLELTKIYGGVGGVNFRKVTGVPVSVAGKPYYYATGIGAPLGTKGL